MAAGSANQVELTFKTKLLKTFRVIVYVASTVVDAKNPIIIGLVALLEALAQAKCIQTALSVTASSAESPAAGAYNTSEDRVRISILRNNDKSANFSIPAPNPAIFLPDKETIDPGNASVIAFLTAMHNNAVGQDGVVAYTNDINGHRDARKRVKR